LFIVASFNTFDVIGQINTPFLDASSTKLSTSTILADQFTELDVMIRNPLNESIYVNVTIFASNITCFPINNSLILLPAKLSNGSASMKRASFVLTPRNSGNIPIDVQLWWNKTQVDSKVFVVHVFSALDPNLWGFWLRVNIFAWGLMLLIVTTLFLDPTWKLNMYNQQTKKIEESSKIVPFLVITGILVVVAYFCSQSYENYYAFVPFLIRLQGKIEPLLAADWIVGIISLGFFMFRKYQWSSSFSRFLFIMLLLMFVSDWLLIPSPPFFGWETIVIVFFSAIINVLLEIGLKDVFNRIRKRKTE
jgi:hypothetical protein